MLNKNMHVCKRLITSQEGSEYDRGDGGAQAFETICGWVLLDVLPVSWRTFMAGQPTPPTYPPGNKGLIRETHMFISPDHKAFFPGGATLVGDRLTNHYGMRSLCH